MKACTIRIPASWIGMDERRVEAFKTRLPEWVSELTPLELLQRWKAKGSSLRRYDRQARNTPENVSLGIMIGDAEYKWLEFTGAAVLRSPEDILAAMLGELQESIATWEKVESAGGSIHAGGVGSATLTQGLRSNPILAGDKVVFLKDDLPRVQQAQFTSRPWCSSWERQGEHGVKWTPRVHSVRSTSVDPITGEQVVHLVGCYGVSSDSNREPGFPTSLLRKVTESRGVIPVMPDDLFQVPVEVSPRIVRQLGSFALFPQVEEIHRWETDEQLVVVCRRWENRWRQSRTIRDASALVREEIETAGSETQVVTMSGLGWHNLDRVCKRLEITPEAWLQGVLFNLAVRCQKMRDEHECCLRNDHKRKG